MAAFGDESRILRSRRTVTLQQQSRDGAAFGKHTFLPHDAGVTVPWGAVLCRSNSELPPPLAPVSPLLAGLAFHLGLGCLKELTLKQASFSFFEGNVRNHSPSYRAQHILVNVLPTLPPHHTLSQDGSPRLSRMCRGTPDTAEQMVEPGFRPRSAQPPSCGSAGKGSARNAGDLGSIPGLGRPLEKGTATHSSIPAWRIP